MFRTLTDASRGKPYSLNQPLEGCRQIGIRTIFMWVGLVQYLHRTNLEMGPRR